jgi:riboflavin transporter FmnP
LNKQKSTKRLTGTALLAAMVIVFDYALKYSGLKIPFPWYPNLKFDFTGVPIVLSMLLYGLSSSFITSLVAGVGIIVRSGNIISASIKVIAELSTVFGLHVSKYLGKNKYIFFSLPIISRILTMTVVNLYVLPNIYGIPFEATIRLLPLIGLFNSIQGAITIGIGNFLFEAIRTRLSQLDNQV